MDPSSGILQIVHLIVTCCVGALLSLVVKLMWTMNAGQAALASKVESTATASNDYHIETRTQITALDLKVQSIDTKANSMNERLTRVETLVSAHRK